MNTTEASDEEHPIRATDAGIIPVSQDEGLNMIDARQLDLAFAGWQTLGR